MRQITEIFTVYKFSDAPEKVKEKIREHFHYDFDLYEHSMQERIATLEKVAELLNGRLDYSISYVPDRGEFISIKPKNESLDFDSLWEVVNTEKDCPFTGVCYDHDIIDHLSKYNLNEKGLQFALDKYIESIHDEYESMLTDEYLADLCEANDYEFLENGRIY